MLSKRGTDRLVLRARHELTQYKHKRKCKDNNYAHNIACENQSLYLRLLCSLLGEELHEMVEVFCDNMDSSVTLPDIGTWVAVRVTAVFNPGHFWVQFPYGSEPIEKRIMAGMLQDVTLCSVPALACVWFIDC